MENIETTHLYVNIIYALYYMPLNIREHGNRERVTGEVDLLKV
jgi:hypothetical protein